MTRDAAHAGDAMPKARLLISALDVRETKT
jgi:hypothetical protein